ncbi:MAG TPA: universal stress protein [Jatrophihabitans sp.]|jgi:nucleotide-binding universal stress UspA family protein
MASAPVIVVGVDGSDSSIQALVWGAKQATLTGSTLRAVATWRWPNYLTRVPPGVDLAGETTQMLHEAVTTALADFSELTVAEAVVDGPAGPALLTQARDASLLVVGARGRAAFPGMLLGSVAEYCVRNGPCPVVVVRASDSAQPD